MTKKVETENMLSMRDARKAEPWWDSAGMAALVYDAATSVFRIGKTPVSNADAERTLKVTSEGISEDIVAQAADAAWEDYKEEYLTLNPGD